MDNTRNLKDTEVPLAARESVNDMVSMIVDNLVNDFIKELNQKEQTIEQDGIDTLTGIVNNRVSITLKIKAAVNLDLVEDMKIPIISIDQVTIQDFAGA